MQISDLYKLFQNNPIITTDSRECPTGSMFFALKGASFDGNQYAAIALEKGCSYAVIDDKQVLQNHSDDRMILVGDVLTTLQQLANYHRRQLGTKIIGITGTNGKTTTKELIATVLSRKYNILYTQGNFNNHIGVPKTLLQLKPEHEFAVIEMGANHPGEIKTLVNIVEPDFGIITNVGKAHIEGFGSFEGVIKTKGELYDYLRQHSTDEKQCPIFIDETNEHLTNIADGLQQIKYGNNGHVIACDPFLRMEYEGREIDTHLIGSYNLCNCLAAATIGKHFEVSDDDICKALAEYIPSNNRSQLQKTKDNTLIIDTYNANPTSMMAALKNFCDMKVDNKMLVLGEMRELGSISDAEHQKIVDFIAQNDSLNSALVWLVGDAFSKTDCRYRKFKDVEEVKSAISEDKPKGYSILIKGSNGTKLFQLPELL
ncbi:MAG: UDP-N-acetylmuramoyl-tripeptide--D-alanyl-D-alanine ligase [Prevotella sp.]|nr:UDP-N-acetylmuramoyl-tripeptide--D-alanyl-D-alanine ligase [Candidatus Equicola stercoris]